MTSDDPIVFVVDDDHRVREALSSLIASAGLRVTAYGSAAEFLEAGAFALGVGADLVDLKAIAKGTPETITENARKYLAIVRSVRGTA